MLASFPSIFQNLRSLRSLRLFKCGIETLPVGMFSNTTQLRNLTLDYNAIQSWDPEVFTPLRRLRRLYLLQNKIVSVNVASFSKLTSLRWLDLRQNPVACNCNLLWFLEYKHKNGISMTAYGQKNTYICASPESLRRVPVVRAGLSPVHCISHTDLVFILSTAAAILLSAIVFVLVYRDRWYIRYYIFLIRSRRRRYLERADGSYVYDAFVAHNSNDASWVVRHLLPRLETEGRYRLCLHQRDWPIGREISENIVDREHRSESQSDRRSLKQLRPESMVPNGVGDGESPSSWQLAQQPRSRTARDDLTGEPECHLAGSAHNTNVSGVERESAREVPEGIEEGTQTAERGATY